MARNIPIIPRDLIPNDRQFDQAQRLLQEQALGESQYDHRQHAGAPLKPADTTYSDMAGRGDGLTAEDYRQMYG